MRQNRCFNNFWVLFILFLGGFLTVPVEAATVPAATQRCKTFIGTASPITHCPSGNYLCYAGALRPLVGVSADAGCHLPLSDMTKCNVSNSQDVLQSLFTGGHNLNKIRLWVSLAGTADTGVVPDFQHPFAYQGGNTWRLDIANGTYFSRLQDVVDYCRVHNITVEITFFAPWEGAFTNGPWDGVHGKVCVDNHNAFQPNDATCTQTGHMLKTAGFSSQDQFVRPGADPVNGNFPRQAQLNLIQMTIDHLYCYDNVYWEIANEPESEPVASPVSPSVVSQWHASMVHQAVTADNVYVGHNPGIATRHVIAVNPTYSTIDYIHATGDLANVDLINGHYTELFANGNMGAIQLIMLSGNTAAGASKLLGFNETKISAIVGKAGTLPLTGTPPSGAPDSARAEGWEFMLNHGAVYDHWGYDYSSTNGNGQAARLQMTNLKNFVGGLVLRQLTKSAGDSTLVPVAPAWVPSLPAWSTYDMTRSARMFWAAMEPTATAAAKQYVLYLHNSLRRCSSGATDPSCGAYMAFNGYSPVIKQVTPNSGYRETLTLVLPAGSYTTEWIEPKTNAAFMGFPAFTLTVNANGSCSGNPNPPCQITSPFYGYDIALKLTKQ